MDRSPRPDGTVASAAGIGHPDRRQRSSRPQATVASTARLGHPDPRSRSHRPQGSVRATAGNGPETESNGHQDRMDRSWEPKLGSPGPIHSPYLVVMMPAHPLPAPAWALAWECGSTGPGRRWFSAVGALPGRKVAAAEVALASSCTIAAAYIAAALGGLGSSPDSRILLMQQICSRKHLGIA
jgi:hypothetical protein